MNPNQTVPSAIPVSSFLATDEAQAQPQSTPQPVAQPKSSGGNWMEKLLPTAGGVLGGILGGVADVGSLGMLAPLINPITGAALGGALGQAGENAATGKQILQGNDITSGIENGVGQLVGEGAAKAVGALGEGITSAGAKAGEKAASDAEKAAQDAAAANDQKATELNFGGVSPEMQKVLKLGDNQDFMQSMGLDHTDPREMQKAAQAGYDINNVYDRALQQAKPVNMSDAGKLLGATNGEATSGLTAEEQAAAKKMGFTPELQAKATVTGGEGAPGAERTIYQGLDHNSPVGQALAEFNKSRGAAPDAMLPEQMNATDVRKLQQAVGRQIGNVQKYVNGAQLSGKYDAGLIGQLQDLNTLYGKLGEKIKTPEVDAAIKNLTVTPADKQGLIDKYGEKLGNHVADTITNAQNADDLLTPMQQFKRMDDLSSMANEDVAQAKATPRATARQKFAANGGIAPGSKTSAGKGLGDTIEAAAKTVHSPTGLVISAGRKLHEAGLTPKVAKGLGNVIKRTAPLLKPAAVVASNIPNVSEASQGGASAIPSNTGEPAMQPGAAPGSPMNSALDNAMLLMNTPGGFLTPGYSSAVQAVDQLAPQVQKNQIVANDISALQPTFANAGGAQGLGGGLLDQLLAKVPGTAQNTYQRQQMATAEQIAKILGITPQAALAMMPQFTQTAQTAAPQQSALETATSQLGGS